MKRLRLFLFIGLVLLSAGCLGEEAKKAEMTFDTKVSEATGSYNATEISAAQFLDMYRERGEYVLIDVRTEQEWNDGHIPGAVHIPYTELDNRMDELGIEQDDKVIVYCEAGVRSKKGANALLDMGYTNVVDITDGMMGWRALGGDMAYPGDKKELEEVVISASELAENLGSVKVIFVGTENQYMNGHIPGAIHVNPLNELNDPDSPVEHMALEKTDFQSLMSSLGIYEEDSLVLYDEQVDQKYAARFYWILKYYGHESAAVLNGGLSAWSDVDGEISLEKTQLNSTDYKAKDADKELIATFDYVKENLNNPGIKLVEATTQEEFENEGHIPGAVLVEPEETLNQDGTIKEAGELLNIYSSKGITRDKEIITYCHTGFRGAVIWFELKEVLEYPNVRLYDGSLEEWNLKDMPLETGTMSTSTIPVIETTTTTSTSTTTTTQKVQEQSYLDVEPTIVLEPFDGTKTVHLDLWESIKVGEDAYIYLSGDMDGCVGIFWWTFNIYQDTPSGGLWEGKTTFMNEQVHSGQDVSGRIHRVSDSLDDYTIVVEKWSEIQGLTLEISH